jgi:membrane protease YdiL (CAAX protease family)
MTPPFPWNLPPRAALRQAATLLLLFYGLVYGAGVLLPAVPRHPIASLLGIFGLGAVMLFAVQTIVRRDVAWRTSLGLGRQAVGSVVGWSLFGFVAAYAANLIVSLGYLLGRGDVAAQAADRVHWMALLADVPASAILPLAAFVAVWEETVFRGFLLGRLRVALPAGETRWARLRRDALAVVLCGLCFGAGHGYQGVLGLMQTTTAGIVLGALAVWRASVWPAIGAHLAIDTFGLLVIKAVARALDVGVGGGIRL